MSAVDRLSYCGQQVRRFDYERYLTCLFAPDDRREALFALYAFNGEVARTREMITEPMMGAFRLQWWRDRIGDIYEGRHTRHEVLDPLARAVARFGLDRARFDRIVDARERDMDEAAPATLEDLEAYADATATPLVETALDILGPHADPVGDAARPAAIAWALTGLLRATPHLARQRRTMLPVDVMEQAGAVAGDLYELRPHAGLTKAVATVAAAATAHCRDAREKGQGAPRTALPALLTVSLTEAHLRVLERAGHDVFDPRVQTGPAWPQARLLWRNVVGRV
ncbi:MAG: phytoene/squalene synthase family protein [Inquilinaceae bacterium]